MGIKGLPPKGGGERVAEAIINKAIEDGFKVTVYGKKDYCQQTKSAIDKNVNIMLINNFKGKHLSGFSFGILSALHALMFGKYDLIHLHYADFGYIVPLLRLRYKVIGTSHGAEYNRGKWGKFAKLFFKMSEIPFVKSTNICTSVSKPLADYYSDKYKKNIFFIPNGMHLNDFNSLGSESCLKYNLLPNKYILFVAGRIIPSKGCDIFLKANRLLKLQTPLVIIGDIKGDVAYKNYINGLAEPNVIFINFVESKKELFEVILNCRFFVFPSTYEAMSMILLEVASLKKGIICSDIPQNFDAIRENAIFFRSNDIDSLASKMQYALSHEDEINRIGEKAFNWVVKERNWKEITEKYIDLYTSI
jgi:glycosyltransferase involved in cell wall biosynthesis